MTAQEEHLKNPAFLEFLRRQAEEMLESATPEELAEFAFGKDGISAAIEAFAEDEYSESYSEEIDEEDFANEFGEDFEKEFADEFAEEFGVDGDDYAIFSSSGDDDDF
jgi:hypothetical protein